MYKKLHVCTGIKNQNLWLACKVIMYYIWSGTITNMSVCNQYKLFHEAGCIFSVKPDGQPKKAKVNDTLAAPVLSPRKSTRQSASHFIMPQATAQKIIIICCGSKSYKYHLLQHVTTQDKEVCSTFHRDFLSELENDKHGYNHNCV